MEQILERRINKRRSEKPGEYKIHYQGWNKRHDEWVLDDRILPKNSSNLLIKKELDERMKVQLENEKRQNQMNSKKSLVSFFQKVCHH